MARNPYTGACLQRCVYAEALVKAATKEANTSVLSTALLQSVIFQLDSAYVLHLREIAENYSHPQSLLINDTEPLSRFLAEQGIQSAEVTEIVALIDDNSSWLAQCLYAYREFQSGLGVPAKVSHGGIDLYQDGERQEKISPELVGRWQRAMLELLERHRALMHEY
ncbi:MAG: hypothetical protein KUG71_07445 [Porticoccaceae bacterium]|nr:hypothetical protein [Porticoccaceae bacterium]